MSDDTQDRIEALEKQVGFFAAMLIGQTMHDKGDADVERLVAGMEAAGFPHARELAQSLAAKRDALKQSIRKEMDDFVANLGKGKTS